MSLAAGTKLGPYEITSLLGAGGMGEVYLAHDVRLGRYVAIKILPDQFSSDSQRMARFEREAKVLASLNHPNIAAIYGLEESNHVPALVMELVDGPTLADRIKQGALPREDALPDRRADIWALGVVLFEMLTGKPAFAGETISDTLAAVIRSDPEWSTLPNDLSPSINRLLHRCLTKDPNQRLRDIGEARIAIDSALSATPEETYAPQAATIQQQ